MRRSLAVGRAASSVLLCFAGAWACGEQLDVYSEVKDLRVLAIRADPPEVLLSQQEILSGAADFAQDVRFEALVLDPRGGALTYRWEFCPVESGRACRDYEDQRAVAPNVLGIDTGARLDENHIFSTEAVAHLEPVPAELRQSPAGVRYDIEDFSIGRHVFARLAPYFGGTTFFGFGQGSWPSAVLHLERDGETLQAQKRVVLGLANFGDFNAQLRDALGYVFCSGPLEPGEEDTCIEVPVLPPNLNPVLADIEKADGELADAPFTSIKNSADQYSIVSVNAGESIRIRPIFPAESLEPYWRIEGDLQTRELRVEMTQEVITVSWFVTHGEVQDGLTTEQYTKTLDTVYTAPLEVPPGEHATVWMVARDQRGGIVWQDVHVRVRPRSSLLTGIRDEVCAEAPGACD